MSGAAGPLVSVVIPAFNSETTLEETLLSAAAQTYRNLEIIVVDDGSTDGTRAVASQFCEKDGRGRVVPVSHGGPGAARNRGIWEASGEFVAFLDADDLWSPEKIRKQVAAALSVENIGFVYTFYRRIDDRGSLLETPTQFEIEGWSFYRHLYWNFVGSGSSILARKAALVELGGFHEALEGCEDYLLQLQLAERYPIACVPEHLFHYRDRLTSLSSDQERMFQGWRQATGLLRVGDRRLRRRVTAWTYSRACWGLAIMALHRGERIKAARFFRWALLGDPYRTFLNAKRVLKRRLVRASPIPGEQIIYDLDKARIDELAEREVRMTPVGPD